MGKIKIYLDEDVRPIIAEILNERGYEAISTIKANMTGKTDKEQIEFAIRNQMALCTHNIKDFVQLHKIYQKEHYGIILSEQIPLKTFLRRLLIFLSKTNAEDIKRQIIWLSKYKEKLI